LRNPLREICAAAATEGGDPRRATADLLGHEAGNGGYSQRKPTAPRASFTRRFPGDFWLEHGRRKPSSPSTRRIRWKGIGGWPSWCWMQMWWR